MNPNMGKWYDPTDRQLVRMKIGELFRQHKNHHTIAGLMAKEGYKTPSGQPITPEVVMRQCYAMGLLLRTPRRRRRVSAQRPVRPAVTVAPPQPIKSEKLKVAFDILGLDVPAQAKLDVITALLK